MKATPPHLTTLEGLESRLENRLDRMERKLDRVMEMLAVHTPSVDALDETVGVFAASLLSV
jgi:hypothetical protein